MHRRIKVASDKEKFIKSLTSSDSGEANTVFGSMGDVISFAALYGFFKKSRVIIQKPSKIIAQIRPEHIATNVVEIVALLDSKQMAILTESSSDDAVTIFEEYANGGLELMKNILKEQKISSVQVNALLAEIACSDKSDNSFISPEDCVY
jgi:dnd system-associated protein 4